MQFSAHEEDDFSLTKFESMLRTNNVFFFDAEEFEEIVHHYLDSGRVGLARKAIKIGLEQHPDSIELKLLHIELLIFENKLEAADEMLNKLYHLEPYNDEVYIHKANVLSKRDDHQMAINVLEQALEITEDPSDIYSMMGMEYLFVDDFTAAKECFIKCLEEDQEDYTALYNVIYCFDFLEDHDGAISFLNDFLDSDPYSEVAWHQLGKQYSSKKMYKEALAAFDFAVICDESFIGAYLEKGKVLEKIGRYNEAIENYETTLTLDDPTSFAYLRLGICHEKLGNDLLAVDFYYKTVHEDPLLDKGWIAITDFYVRKGNYRKALYYINKAIQIDTENTLYWKRSGDISRVLQLYEEADVSYRKTVELGNYELDTWYRWSEVLNTLGEYDTAAQVLLQARVFYPENAEIEYRLAGLYYLQSDDHKGLFHLRNALREDYKGYPLFKELYPRVFKRASVHKAIADFGKRHL